MRLSCGYIALASILISCAGSHTAHRYEFGSGKYLFREDKAPYKKVHVYFTEEGVSIFDRSDDPKPIHPDRTKTWHFIEQSFDVDVMTIIFKYRPKAVELPRQLTTEFNGNLFLGYRLDRFKMVSKNTPVGTTRRQLHRGMCVGIFGGLGETSVTPWTTNYRITDEYSALVLTRGGSVMLAINNLTVGVGVGFDHLTDRDKGVWIYQDKPWYGLTFSLNLN